MAKAVPNLQADIIAFQYRGFGQSDGEQPTEQGIKLDIESICAYVK